MPIFTVDLSDEDIKAVMALAGRRDVSPNTVIQQAISTEKLIADNVGPSDELLIKKGTTFQKVVFGKK